MSILFNCCIDLVQCKRTTPCVLCDIDNLLLKVIWKCKVLRILKTTLRKKSKVVGLAIARYEDLQSYGNEAGTQQGKKSEPIKPWRAQRIPESPGNCDDKGCMAAQKISGSRTTTVVFTTSYTKYIYTSCHVTCERK